MWTHNREPDCRLGYDEPAGILPRTPGQVHNAERLLTQVPVLPSQTGPSRVARSRGGASRLPRAVAGLALALPLLAVLLPAGAAQAQQLRFLVSNTGRTALPNASTGDIDVGHSVAQGFRTGDNAAGYFLTTVGLPLGVVSGGSTAVTLRESSSA